MEKRGQIILGDFLDGGDMVWSAFETGEHKIALVGEGEKFSSIFNRIEEQIIAIEGVVYFKICNGFSESIDAEGTLVDMREFEKEPVDAIPNEFLADHRKDFVNMYVELVSSMIGLERQSLRVSYRPTMEGPLWGYFRAAEELEGDLSTIFKEHINALDNINWGNKGDLYTYKLSDSDESEKLLDFLRGVWSFWMFAMLTPVDMPKVLHLEIPNSALYSEYQVKCLDRIIEIIEEISNMSNLVVILTTDSLEPLQRSSVRYKLLVNNYGKDFDFRETALDFDGEGDVFILLDDIYKRKYVGKTKS